MLFFKTVDSRDAVTKATWMYSRRVLKDSMEATCSLFIAILLNDRAVIERYIKVKTPCLRLQSFNMRYHVKYRLS